MIESFIQKSMTGLYIMGHAMGNEPECGTTMAMLLVGHYDLELKCSLFYRRFGKIATDVEELDEVNDDLARIKDVIRTRVQLIFDEADRQEKLKEVLKKKQEKEALDARIREAEKPHELGTVAEIAAKYGISKSEVRKMRAAGTLHTLVTKHGQ